ncbi:MAG: hypothetical protein RL596_2009, partial [Bacteroidota bacterium]
MPTKYYYCIHLLLVLLPQFMIGQGIPIGQWRDHLNYQNTFQVIKGDKIYASTLHSIFSIDEKNDLARYNKVTHLSDTHIATIGWDSIGQQLIIGYQNGNIDLLKGYNTTNIPDVLKSTFIGNKKYNHCFVKDGFAYLSAGLGVLVVNLSRKEIKETWIMGNSGNQIPVFAVSFFNNHFYAATAEGLKFAQANNTDLVDYRNWQNLSGINGLGTGTITNIGICNNQVYVQKNDSILFLNNTTWQTLYTEPNWFITQSNFYPNTIHLSQKNSNGNARVIILNSNGIITKTISRAGILSEPRASLQDGNSYWVADFFGGLSKHTNTIERFIPNGPPATASGEFSFVNDTIYAAAGSVNISWNYLFNRNGIYSFNADTWNAKNYFNTPLFDSV